MDDGFVPKRVLITGAAGAVDRINQKQPVGGIVYRDSIDSANL